MSKKSKRAQVEQDEVDATTREGVRQAGIEAASAKRVIDDAAQAAAKEPTAPAAKRKFWEKVRDWFDSSEH